MSKLDALKRSAGNNVAESASRRYEPLITPPAAAPNAARMDGVVRSRAAMEIPLAKIERDPGQPREEFDEDALSRLADSIRARGLLQPVRVRWDEDRQRYILIAGERRWRAAGRAGLATLTCIVTDAELPPAELLAVQVTENALREDLKPLERAKAFRTLMDLNGWSGNQLSKELGISQASVVQALALLDLPPAVQDRVESGELAPTVGYEISKLPDAESQVVVAARVVSEGLSRAEAAEEVRRSGGGSKARRDPRGKPRKVTARTFKVGGYRLTVENSRGIEIGSLLDALREVVARVEAEPEDVRQGRGEAA